MTRIAVGCDHAGFQLKCFLVAHLSDRGFLLLDLGTNTGEPVDYPSYCIAVAKTVADGKADWGIVLGGSGQGEQMAANKVAGVRAALCNDPWFARLARRDNDANVIAIGARIVAPEFAVEILQTWITTAFEGGRHKRRIDLISDYEQNWQAPDSSPGGKDSMSR